MSNQIQHHHKSEHRPITQFENENNYDNQNLKEKNFISNHLNVENNHEKNNHDKNHQTNKNGLDDTSRSGSDTRLEETSYVVSQQQSKSDSQTRSVSKTKHRQILRSKRRSSSRSPSNRRKRSSRKHKDRSTSPGRHKTKYRSSSRSSSKTSTKKHRKKKRTRSIRRSRSRTWSRNRSYSRSRSRSESKRYGSPSSSKQIWWQSLKPQPIVHEPRKIWDGFQWVVRNPSSDVNSVMISQARKDRRLYIGNLPSDVPPEQLRDFMENILRGCIQIPDDIEKVVSAAWIGPTGTFGFIEVATVEIATIALGLGRIEFNGSMLRISRPNDYQEQANLGFLAGVIGKTT